MKAKLRNGKVKEGKIAEILVRNGKATEIKKPGRKAKSEVLEEKPKAKFWKKSQKRSK